MISYELLQNHKPGNKTSVQVEVIVLTLTDEVAGEKRRQLHSVYK